MVVERCQTQSEPSVTFTHWQSHPTLSLNFKDRFQDESALHRTALVITAKQKKYNLIWGQILSKSQQSLLSSKLPHHQNEILYPVFSSFLTGCLCSWPYVTLTDHLFTIRSALLPGVPGWGTGTDGSSGSFLVGQRHLVAERWKIRSSHHTPVKDVPVV